MKVKIDLAISIAILVLLYSGAYFFSSTFINSLTNEFIYAESQGWAFVLIYLLTFICLSMESDILQEFYIDRVAILIFIGFSILPLLGLASFLQILLIVILIIGIIYRLIIKWHVIRSPGLNWVSTSVFYTLILAIFPATIVILFYVNSSSYFMLHKEFPTVSLILGMFLFNIGLSAAWEEMFFRGLLWGYMNKMGINIKYSFVIQFVLFWLWHYEGVKSDASFFISLPLEIFVQSFLAYKSKQLTPSIISHALYNTIAPILWRLLI